MSLNALADEEVTRAKWLRQGPPGYTATVTGSLTTGVATFAFVTEIRLYWFFVALTPVLLILVLAGKRRSEGFSVFPTWKEWPWWKLIASTIAFLVWALAIPGTPYLSTAQGKMVAAFGALLVSTFLTLLEPIFEPSRSRKPQAAPKPPLRGEDFRLG
jgi:hypothetical protein